MDNLLNDKNEMIIRDVTDVSYSSTLKTSSKNKTINTRKWPLSSSCTTPDVSFNLHGLSVAETFVWSCLLSTINPLSKGRKNGQPTLLRLHTRYNRESIVVTLTRGPGASPFCRVITWDITDRREEDHFNGLYCRVYLLNISLRIKYRTKTPLGLIL